MVWLGAIWLNVDVEDLSYVAYSVSLFLWLAGWLAGWHQYWCPRDFLSGWIGGLIDYVLSVATLAISMRQAFKA